MLCRAFSRETVPAQKSEINLVVSRFWASWVNVSFANFSAEQKTCKKTCLSFLLLAGSWSWVCFWFGDIKVQYYDTEVYLTILGFPFFFPSFVPFLCSLFSFLNRMNIFPLFFLKTSCAYPCAPVPRLTGSTILVVGLVMHISFIRAVRSVRFSLISVKSFVVLRW